MIFDLTICGHTFASHLAMSGADLLTLKDLLGYTNIQMTTRYAHLFQEHKAQAVTRLAERFLASQAEMQSVVSSEIKQALGALQRFDLAQNRNISFVRKGRGLRMLNEVKRLEVARDGIELPTRGFQFVMVPEYVILSVVN